MKLLRTFVLALLGIALAMSPATRASEPVVIGDWENQMDGWERTGSTGSYNNTVGVTRGDYSLEAHVPPGWQGIIRSYPDDTDLLQAFKDNDTISLDVTRIVADWSPGDPPQWSDIKILIAIGGDGWSLQESLGPSAGWVPEHGDKTQTGVWSYAGYLDEIDLETLSWVQLKVISCCDDINYTGEVVLYLDNMQLSATEPVYFADQNLKQAVIDELGRMGMPTDAPTAAHMAQLRDLNAGNCEIHDLTGLESAVALEYLHLHHNQVTNLQPLAGLTTLRELNIEDNLITDISLIAELTGLRLLAINNNPIQSVSVLSNMTMLETLDAGWTQISNIDALSDLTSLRKLNIQHNLIGDISALSNLTGLEILRIYNNFEIQDLGPVAGMTMLEELNAKSNQISDLTALSDKTNLHTLILNWNQISDLSPLVNLNVSEVQLHNNSISDIWPLTTLMNLTHLDLLSNPLNTDACTIHIPDIFANNPGVTIEQNACFEPGENLLSNGGFESGGMDPWYLYTLSLIHI